MSTRLYHGHINIMNLLPRILSALNITDQMASLAIDDVDDACAAAVAAGGASEAAHEDPTSIEGYLFQRTKHTKKFNFKKPRYVYLAKENTTATKTNRHTHTHKYQ